MKAKQKKCKACRQPFTPWTSMQTACSPKCALELVRARQRAERRKDTRRRKEALKTLPELIKEAQPAFNRWVRFRDRGQPCISCGKTEQELMINNPVAMVCGHYLSVGAHPELRFHPFNAHLQCTRCNGGAGKYGQFNSKAKTVTQDYRIRLIDKIGLANVEWLEGQHQSQNWTLDEIRQIKQFYNEQYRILKND